MNVEREPVVRRWWYVGLVAAVWLVLGWAPALVVLAYGWWVDAIEGL